MADTSDVETSEERTETPVPSRRGRKPGSKNRVGADARALLAEHGLAGIRALCSIAAGRAVYRPLKGGGRERLVPELADMISAQKAILSRLVPELKATELTGKDGAALIPGSIDPSHPNYYHEASKSILSVFQQAVPDGGKVTVEEPGTYTAKFNDAVLGRRLFVGDEAAAADGSDAGPGYPPSRNGQAPASESRKAAKPNPSEPTTIGGQLVVAFNEERQKFCICFVGNASPIEWRSSFDDACERASWLLNNGKLGLRPLNPDARRDDRGDKQPDPRT